MVDYFLWLPWSRAYLPQGPPGACICFASPLCSPNPPSIRAHQACEFPISPLPTPLILAPWPVSCSLSSWPALGEGQIFTTWRLTQDRTGIQKTGVSLRVTKTEGKAWFSSRRRVWGKEVLSFSCLCCHAGFLRSFK